MKLRSVLALALTLVCAPAIAQETKGTSPLSIAKGGTAGGTQQSALNNLMCSPTRSGDVSYYNGTNWVCLAGNNSGTQVFGENSSGVPSWLSNVSGPGSATSGDLASFNGTTGALIQDSGIAAANVAQLSINNTFTGGLQTFSGVVQSNTTYFGGRPWFDVKSTANGCAAAALNGSTDDTSAIQCHINYMVSTFGGGIVFFPPSTSCALVSNTVNVYAGVWLEGSGAGGSNSGVSCIQTATDINVVDFAFSSGSSGQCPGGGHLGGMEKMAILGYTNSAAGQPTVKIGINCSVTIRDSKLWYGAQGLFNSGVDSLIEGSFICGYSGCVQSNGANWYVRDKLDSVVTMVAGAEAFIQGAYVGPGGATTIAENHFVETDFSGNFQYSLYIDDSNNASAITHVNGGVFSSAVFLNHMKYTIIEGTEIGSTSFAVNAGTLLMSASPAFSSTTITGAGGLKCATNSNTGFTNC